MIRRRSAGAHQPKGNGGRLAAGILHPDDAGLDAQDPPRGVAELEDIAG